MRSMQSVYLLIFTKEFLKIYCENLLCEMQILKYSCNHSCGVFFQQSNNRVAYMCQTIGIFLAFFQRNTASNCSGALILCPRLIPFVNNLLSSASACEHQILLLFKVQ